jgi:hypothetical protein
MKYTLALRWSVMTVFYVRVFKKHLVYVRRYEPSSLQETRGFIYYAGMGHKVTVTAVLLLALLGLAPFCPCNNPRVTPVHERSQTYFTHQLIRMFGVQTVVIMFILLSCIILILTCSKLY